MPLKLGCSKKALAENMRTLRREGYGAAQAMAIAYRIARKNKLKCSHRGHLRKKSKKKGGRVSFTTASGERVSFATKKKKKKRKSSARGGLFGMF